MKPTQTLLHRVLALYRGSDAGSNNHLEAALDIVVNHMLLSLISITRDKENRTDMHEVDMADTQLDAVADAFASTFPDLVIRLHFDRLKWHMDMRHADAIVHICEKLLGIMDVLDIDSHVAGRVLTTDENQRDYLRNLRRKIKERQNAPNARKRTRTHRSDGDAQRTLAF